MPTLRGKKWFVIFTSSLLVAGNVLGVGLLALPIKLGISGYFPTITDMVIICTIMLLSAFVIAERLPFKQEVFDIPSFFKQELGNFGRWIAIVCNLILLYGVLVAYLSGISSIFFALFNHNTSQTFLIIGYFLLATSIVVFGQSILRRSNAVLLILIFICFVVLIFSGSSKFEFKLLVDSHWKYLPLGLPVIISVFHFHNVIPTLARFVDRNIKALRWAIFIGVAIGFVMNVAWVTVVLGTLPQIGAGDNGIIYAFVHNLPATVPMTRVLHSETFTAAGLIFAVLAVTASYVANGAGLQGFIRDLVYTFTKTTNRLVVGVVTFLPPLIITIVYPHIFLKALDIVGGVGETILFVILPGLILSRINRRKSTLLPRILTHLGYFVATVGLFVLLFVIFQKFGFVHMGPKG